MIQEADRLQMLINWQFTLKAQNQSSRFGVYNEEYWKQFLPFGKPFPDQYPPRRITKLNYDLAVRQFNAVK
jgi:hypothetical protein